eukprot:scaffold3931_cov124-Pinguiococcus_pyrenoidosus.AAC.1
MCARWNQAEKSRPLGVCPAGTSGRFARRLPLFRVRVCWPNFAWNAYYRSAVQAFAGAQERGKVGMEKDPVLSGLRR